MFLTGIHPHAPTSQVLVEEKPRLQLPPRLKAKESSQGLTHLASVSLRAVSALVSPMDDDPAAPSGLNVQLSVEDLQLLDLQGCVEHRNVLVGNRRPHPTPQRPGPRPQRSGLAAAGTRPSAEQQWQGTEQQGLGTQWHEDEPCRLELICQVPGNVDLPVQMVLSLQDPCITFMRKFVNNVLYAVFAIIKGAKGDTSSVAAAAAAAVAAPDASAAGAAAAQAAVAALASPQQRPPPVVIIKVWMLSGHIAV